MKTNKKTVIGILTAVIISAADTQAGRWLSRDPIEDEAGFVQRDPADDPAGPNPYAFVANSPVMFTDPFGLWKWEGGMRQGRERAIMLPEAGDTTSSAASFTKLDPSETRKWLRDSKGHWVAPGETIVPCLKYDVPNTFVIGVGYGGYATALLAAWQNDLSTALEKRGFYVAPYRYDTGTTDQQMETAARGKDVWGLALFGHGYKKIKHWYWWSPEPGFDNGALAWDEDKSQLIAPRTVKPLSQKYGLLIMYFCYADLSEWPSLVSPNGQYYGGSGSVSALSGPRTLGYWGSWDGLVEGATK